MFQIVYDFVFDILIGQFTKVDYEPILSDLSLLLTVFIICLLLVFCVKFVIWCFNIVNVGRWFS